MANFLNWIAKTFSKDPSKMLIFTGVAGWTLSSAAQILGIIVNPKIKEEQKVFLIPQEISDAVVNIGCFFLITQLTKKTVSKAFSTGKFAPKSVREFLKNHSDLYANKVGKLDFDLDKVLKKHADFPADAYYKVKNLGTAAATVGAGIIATNIITPIYRNRMAAVVQKTYINEYKNPEMKKPATTTNTQPAKIQKPAINPNPTSGSMRI